MEDVDELGRALKAAQLRATTAEAYAGQAAARVAELEARIAELEEAASALEAQLAATGPTVGKHRVRIENYELVRELQAPFRSMRDDFIYEIEKKMLEDVYNKAKRYFPMKARNSPDGRISEIKFVRGRDESTVVVSIDVVERGEPTCVAVDMPIRSYSEAKNRACAVAAEWASVYARRRDREEIERAIMKGLTRMVDGKKKSWTQRVQLRD